MQNEKCYKDPEIRLTQLANYLNVNPNYLSQVINSKENKNFMILSMNTGAGIQRFLNRSC